MDLVFIIAFLIVMWACLRLDIKGKKLTAKKNNRKKDETSPAKEYVYVISNPSFHNDIFKIGLTTQEPERRMKQLYSTGVPTPFDVGILIKTDDCKKLEKELHERYSIKRVNSQREFFRLDRKDLHDIITQYCDDKDSLVNWCVIERVPERPLTASQCIEFRKSDTIV